MMGLAYSSGDRKQNMKRYRDYMYNILKDRERGEFDNSLVDAIVRDLVSSHDAVERIVCYSVSLISKNKRIIVAKNDYRHIFKSSNDFDTYGFSLTHSEKDNMVLASGFVFFIEYNDRDRMECIQMAKWNADTGLDIYSIADSYRLFVNSEHQIPNAIFNGHVDQKAPMEIINNMMLLMDEKACTLKFEVPVYDKTIEIVRTRDYCDDIFEAAITIGEKKVTVTVDDKKLTTSQNLIYKNGIWDEIFQNENRRRRNKLY
jgi:hypothetical protein